MLNFPPNPTDGQEHSDNGLDFIYRDPPGCWTIVATEGGASVTVSDTAPTDPVDGDLWYCTAEVVGLFCWYVDEDFTGSWIMTNGGGGGGGGGASITVGPDFPDPATDNALHYKTSEVVGLYVRYNDGTGDPQWVQTNGGAGAGNPVEIAEADAIAGYQVWGDVIVQWGQAGSSANGTTITFPKAFKTIPVVSCGADVTGVGGSEGQAYNASTITATDFVMVTRYMQSSTGVATQPASWIAIGEALDADKKSKTVQTIGGSELQEYHDQTEAGSWRIVGSTLECWGVATNPDGSGYCPITFPKEFATLPNLQLTPLGQGNRAGGLETTSGGELTTTGAVARVTVANSAAAAPAGETWQWRAIGEWNGS